ncbi:MAG: suppressor of fused domain protein, partial [Micromonosporaceae bacterium]
PVGCRDVAQPFDENQAGGRTYRYPGEPEAGAPAPRSAERDEIAAHIARQVGPVERVWPEVFGELLHVDIHMVAPTEQRPYVTLVTAGMSDRAMTVPPETGSPAYAELLLCLPAEWPRTESDWADDRNHWPLRMLRQLARMPHAYGTWLDAGHTVPNGEPPAPLASHVGFTAMLVAPPFLVGPDVFRLTTSSGRSIAFYGVIPLYAEELQRRLSGAEPELMELLGEHEVTELLDPARPSVC